MQELFDHIEIKGITPNQYYMLWCISMKRVPKHINTALEMRCLTTDGYIKDSKITQKGEDVLGKLVSLPTKAKTTTYNVDDYLELFPKGKLPSGKPARVNKRNIEEAFGWFFKNYDYEWTTVLKATSYYVDTYEKDNYKYMRNSQYFIRKQNTDKTWDSELANCCDIVLGGDDLTDNAHFSERVV